MSQGERFILNLGWEEEVRVIIDFDYEKNLAHVLLVGGRGRWSPQFVGGPGGEYFCAGLHHTWCIRNRKEGTTLVPCGSFVHSYEYSFLWRNWALNQLNQLICHFQSFMLNVNHHIIIINIIIVYKRSWIQIVSIFHSFIVLCCSVCTRSCTYLCHHHHHLKRTYSKLKVLVVYITHLYKKIYYTKCIWQTIFMDQLHFHFTKLCN